MHAKVLKPFVFVLAVMAVVSLACGVFSSGQDIPTTAPEVQQPATQPPQVQAPTEQPIESTPIDSTSNNSSGGYVTFTDQNNLYSIEVPADWVYSQTVDTQDNNYYIDTFKSPDEGAVIENIVYDDGTAFTGNQKAKFSLYLLNTFYSSTGKEGDIKVSDDSIMKDGSERLTWTSKGGGYSGLSFLEVRSNGTTFLFFTVNWGNDVQDTYIDTLNYVIESYKIP